MSGGIDNSGRGFRIAFRKGFWTIFPPTWVFGLVSANMYRLFGGVFGRGFGSLFSGEFIDDIFVIFSSEFAYLRRYANISILIG